MKAEQLWKELHYLFDTDDGSLPEIWLSNLSPDGVVAIFSYLQNTCDGISNDSSFWSTEEQKDKPINSVPNAAAVVIEGLAEPFHCLCERPTYNGVVIPDLGVFVSDNQICLDYRMGEEWSTKKLEALFGILKEVNRICLEAKVSIEDNAPSKVRIHFESTWEKYLWSKNDV
jgi:hypothetical protein